MRERKAIYVTKHNQKYQLYSSRVAREPRRYEIATRDAGVQYNYLRDFVCTCRDIPGLRRPQEVRYFSNNPKQVFAFNGSRSFTDIGVGSVKTVQKRKVRRIYLPETDDKGIGSSDLSSFFTRKPKLIKGSNFFSNKNTSTSALGGVIDDAIVVIHEKLSPITYTNTGSTSPKLSVVQNQKKDVEIGSSTQGKTLASISTQIDETTKIDDLNIEVRAVKVSIENEKESTKQVKKSKHKISDFAGAVKEKPISKRAQEAERVFSSDSLVEHVHNLENPSEDKHSHADVMENKLEREYRRMFSPKSKEFKDHKIEDEKTSMKSTSLLRRRFEALRRGLAKKEDSKRSAVVADKESTNGSELSKRDVSIASDPPSLESRSYSDVKINSPYPNTEEYVAPNPKPIYAKSSTIKRHSNRAAEDEDSSYQGATGMFKLWGKKFNFEDEDIPQSSKDQGPNITNESSNKKDGKRFFFFKKKIKDKTGQIFKQKKGLTAGRCEVGDGLMIKIGAAHPKPPPIKQEEHRVIEKIPEEYEEMFRKAWLQKFLSQTIESRNSVKIRWNNNAYATSSSTIFEIMENVYKDTGIIFRSKSEVTAKESSYYKSYPRQRVNFVQDIEAWMVPNCIPDNIITPPPPKNVNDDDEYSNKNKIQVRISDQKWTIDKTKAFAHKIEVVLHSRNVVKRHKNSSTEYLTIDIPKSFFSDSATESGDAEQSSNEEVYKIVEYDSPESNTPVNKANFEIGDYLKDIKVTVSLKDSRNFESKIIETVIKRPPIQRDVVIQGSKVYIPKRCNVIGVGIITQNDITMIRKPILKIHDEYSDDESEHSMHIGHIKSKFAESYLQDYYRHWTPLGIDFFSWCVSDSQIQCCSDISQDSVNNQGDGTKSCPNIYDDYLASTVISSCGTSCCSPCGPSPPGACDIWDASRPGIVSKFYNKLKPKLKLDCQETEKRVLPKDSLEVFKRRKLYALSAKSQWGCPNDRPYSIPSIESRGAQDTLIDCPKVKKSCWKPVPKTQKNKICEKHVSLPDCDELNTSLVKQLSPLNPSGILTFKGAAKCEMCEKKGSICTKHATVNPNPVCEIPPPRRPCLDDPPPPQKPPSCRPAPPCGTIVPIHDCTSQTSGISISLTIGNPHDSPEQCRHSPKSCYSAPGLSCSPHPCNILPKEEPRQTPVIACHHSPPCPSPPMPCHVPPKPCFYPPRPCDSPPRPCDFPPRPCYSPPRPCYSPPRPCYSPPRPCHSPPYPPPPCGPRPKPCYVPLPKCTPKPCHPFPSPLVSPHKLCPPPKPCYYPRPPKPCQSPPKHSYSKPCYPKPLKPCHPPPESCKIPSSPCPHSPPKKPCPHPKPPEPCESSPKPCPKPPPAPCDIPAKPCDTPHKPCSHIIPPTSCDSPPEPCETPPKPCPPKPCDTPPEPCETPPKVCPHLKPAMPCEPPPKPCSQPKAPKPCDSPTKPCPYRKPPKPCDSPPTPCPHPKPPKPCDSPPKPCPHAKPPKPCDSPPKPCPHPKPPEPCDSPPKPCPLPKPPKPCDSPPKSCPHSKPPKPCDPPPKPCPHLIPVEPCETPPKPCDTPPTCEKPKKKKCWIPGKPPCGSPPVSGIHLYSPPRSTCSSPTPPSSCQKPVCPMGVSSSSSYGSPPCTPEKSSSCEKPKDPCDPTPSCDNPFHSISATSCGKYNGSHTLKKKTPCSVKPNSCSYTPPCKPKPACPHMTPPKSPPKPACEKPSTESCKVKDGPKDKIRQFLDLPTGCEPPKPKCAPENSKSPPIKPACPHDKKPTCNACKKVCSQEFPWPLKNQISNQASLVNLSQCVGPSDSDLKRTYNLESPPDEGGCGRKPVQCPSKPENDYKSPPRISGIFLKLRPGRKCSNECNSSQPCGMNVKNPAGSTPNDDIIINIKKGTDSTDEIREGLNIKVQDYDGNTLYERRDYTNNIENVKKQKRPSVLNEMYKNSNVHVVSTSRTVQDMECNEESNINLTEIKSEASVANLIEINFRLKVTQGDKTTEFNIGTDDVLDRSKNHTKNQIGQTSQEVFMLKDEAEQCTDETNDKNDINIKIIIKNYKPKTKNKPLCDEFAQSITEKFQTVSTGYSDFSNKKGDNVYSAHRTTVNLASSNEESKTDIQTKDTISSKELNEEGAINIVKSCSSVPDKLSIKYSHSKTDVSKTDNVFQCSDKENNDIQNYVYKEENQYSVKMGNCSSTIDHDNRETEKESDSLKPKSLCDATPKSLTREEKKSILKKVLEKVRKTNKKEKMKQFTDVLNLILTDSSDHDEATKEGNDLVKEMTYASLNPNYFRDTDSMNNYYKVESSASSRQESDDNPNVKYPTQNVSESSVRDSDESYEEDQNPGTCLCSTFAARLNVNSTNGGGCCCRYPAKADEETFCDLRTEEDFLLLNYKTIEYIDVETQNSKYFCNGNKVSLHSRAVSSSFQNDDEDIVEVLKKSERVKRSATDFACCASRRQSCQYKKLNRNKLGISDKDEVYFLNATPTNVAVAAEIPREFKMKNGEKDKLKREYAKYERLADILQSYETKKAVLEIYAERTVSDEGHLVAKLPKFVYDKESDIERNYEDYVSSMYDGIKNKFFMMSVKR